MYEYYFNPGDQTHDFLTHFVIPVGNRRVGLEFKYVPVEYFRMDSIVSRERRTLSGKAAEGYSLGDIYFGTMVQLIKDQGYIPDVMISLACRTASGTSRDYARYTDMPGYYFDVSIGDSYGRAAGFFRSVRWYGEVGFYVYQTFLDNYPQNDALLYGIGFDLDFSLFYLNQSIRGYNGYMYNGDHPLVYRADFGFKFGSAALVVGYEKGIRDFPFESIRAGFQINGLSEKEE